MNKIPLDKIVSRSKDCTSCQLKFSKGNAKQLRLYAAILEFMPSIYHLMQDKNSLAAMTRTGGDFPWIEASFEPTDKYAEFKPLFDREYQSMEAEDWDEWDKVYKEFQSLNIHMVDEATGEEITEFILHIIDDKAHLRY